MNEHDKAYWIADKIVALGDYAKEAAMILKRQADEIAALKAGQGEPVAWALQHKNGLAFEWEGFIQPTYEKAEEMQRRHVGSPTIVKLYTSAPIQPEGCPDHQEARECILRAHIALSNRRGGSQDAPREHADEAQIELESALKISSQHPSRRNDDGSNEYLLLGARQDGRYTKPVEVWLNGE